MMNEFKTSSLKAAKAIHDAIYCEDNGEGYEIPSVEEMAEMIYNEFLRHQRFRDGASTMVAEPRTP